MLMRKEDLKDGMAFEQRNGKRFLVLGERAYNKNGWVNINDYTGDLNTWEGITKFGIAIIYKLKGVATSFKDLLDDENLEVIWRRKEPVKLTQYEKETLGRVYERGFKYIARDEDSGLFAYANCPNKCYNHWRREGQILIKILTRTSDFRFVKWEDSEPTNIQELLDNCEVEEC